ncbi:restriction endonuclease subunit S, partial [Butyricicoccus sp. AF35-5AC]|uniref:restriction endonuclease subunit S n=2 Tax=unclassified Butyricicoccus TaxID=2633649 RepID=UPI001FA9F29C
NDNLQQQAMSLYAEMFLNSSDSNVTSGTLSDIAVITMGQSPSGSSYNEDGVGEVFYQGRAEFGFRFPKRRLFTTEPKRKAEAGDVLLSVRAPVGDLNIAYERCCIGRGLGAIHSKTGHSSFVLYTMFALRSQLDVFNGEGTVFGSINRDALNAIPIDIPPVTEIDQFEVVAHPIDELIRANYEENCRLEAIRDSLLPKLMSGEIDVCAVQL